MILTPTGLRFHGRKLPCSIGKGGVKADKREGDGATPAGIHKIVGMYYRPDRMRALQDWATPIGNMDLWSDASGDQQYNLHVRRPYDKSHEVLRRSDPLYDLILVTDYNWPNAVAGKGSAIFIHQWRRPGWPTEGCIAFQRDHLRWIAERIEPGTRVIVPEAMSD